MEARNRCFDQNIPEETNRKIVDHISDINLPYTEHSRRYLLSEGIRKEYIFVTGEPMQEVLQEHMDEIDSSDVLDKLGLEAGKYISTVEPSQRRVQFRFCRNITGNLYRATGGFRQGNGRDRWDY